MSVSAEPTDSSSTKNHLVLGDILGIAFLFGWSLSILCLGDASFADSAGQSVFWETSMRATYLGGIAIGAAACVAFMKQLSNPRPLLCCCATALTLCYFLPALLAAQFQNVVLSSLCWAAAGVGEGIWFHIWILRLRTLSVSQYRFTIAYGMAAGGAIVAILALMLSEAMLITDGALPILWLVVFLSTQNTYSREDPFLQKDFEESVSTASPIERAKSVFTLISSEGLSKVLVKGLLVCMYAYISGIVLSYLVSALTTESAGLALGLLTLLTGVTIYQLQERNELLTASIVPNLFISVSCVAFFGIAFFYPSVQSIIFAVVMSVLCAALWVTSILSSFNYVSFLPIRFIFEIWSSKTCSALGCFIGWLVGSAIFDTSAGASDGGANSATVTYVLFASIVAVVILNEIFFKKSRLVLNRIVVNEEETLAVQEVSTILSVSPKGSNWNEACELLAQRFALSPRQKEVFMLLACGRNTEFIASKLNVSVPTVKSHTYTIYQKLNIHSHQALIDMIETTSLTT